MSWAGMPSVMQMMTGMPAVTASRTASAQKAAGKVICIDPGHGGDKPGAVYHKRGRPEDRWTLEEKEINLDVALNLRDKLGPDGAGATVLMTRTDDSTTSLEERVKICSGGAHITVSVHTNSTHSSRWDGSLIVVAKDDDWPLAKAIHPIMYDGLKENWEGLFTDYGINEAAWYIPLHTDMPAVILEPVFMSNHDEAVALRQEAGIDGSRRAQIVQVAYDGIVAYFAP